VCTAAADAKQGKQPASQPTTPAASTSRVKPETEGGVEEMIQSKKAAAPTKTGNCRPRQNIQIIVITKLASVSFRCISCCLKTQTFAITFMSVGGYSKKSINRHISATV